MYKYIYIERETHYTLKRSRHLFSIDLLKNTWLPGSSSNVPRQTALVPQRSFGIPLCHSVVSDPGVTSVVHGHGPRPSTAWLICVWTFFRLFEGKTSFPIWRCPIRLPLNHPFYNWMVHSQPAMLGTPIYGNPHLCTVGKTICHEPSMNHPSVIIIFKGGIHMGVSTHGATPNGWFIRENPIKMILNGWWLGLPPFMETPICIICIIIIIPKWLVYWLSSIHVEYMS